MTKILREPICSLAGSAPPRSLFPMNYLNPASSARAHLVRVHSYTRARANAFSLARYASRRRRLEMEMEVEVCHRVNGPLSFLRPLPPLFFFFLFLLPGRLLVSWPFGPHGCISLGHEPLPFCRALPRHLSPYIPSPSSRFLRFSDCTKDTIPDLTCGKSSFLPSEISLANELFDISHVSLFTASRINRSAVDRSAVAKFASA